MAVMWCMPRDNAMSGAIVSTGSGHVSALMASSSPVPFEQVLGRVLEHLAQVLEGSRQRSSPDRLSQSRGSSRRDR